MSLTMTGIVLILYVIQCLWLPKETKEMLDNEKKNGLF